MPETQGKGRGEGAVEKNTSRPNEQGGSGGGSSSGKKDDAAVKSVQEKTRDGSQGTLSREQDVCVCGGKS